MFQLISVLDSDYISPFCFHFLQYIYSKNSLPRYKFDDSRTLSTKVQSFNNNNHLD